MTALIGWFVNLFTNGLLGKLVDMFKAGTAALSNTTIARVNAGATVAQAEIGGATQLAIADKTWWLTALMKPVCFYTFMMHVGAVVIDTTFKLHWGIPKLPAPYADMEANVIYICLGIVGAWGLTRLIVK